MNKYEEAVRQLQKGIETYVDKKISETKFDKTYIGIITAVTDNNTYSVNIKNVIYNNVPVAGNAVCKLNEIVKVLVPMSNFNNMFIINVNNDYVNNINKPTINGVEIVGNLTQEDLHIETVDTISEFGGFIQSKGKFFNNSKDNKNVGMSPNNNRYALWAGETNKKDGLIGESDAYFKLKQDGELCLNSDNVANKGNLFIDFVPQNKDEIYSIYYQQGGDELGEEELIDLPSAQAIKIEHEMVYFDTIDEKGVPKTVFDPSAYFADMGNGFISRISKSNADEFSNIPFIQNYDKNNIKSGTNNTVSAPFGAFTCYSSVVEQIFNYRDPTIFRNTYNGLTVSFNANFAALSILTMYITSLVDDENEEITFTSSHYSPLYWNQNPAWDARVSSFPTVYIENDNLKDKYLFNCFISKSGKIYEAIKQDSGTKKNYCYLIFRMNCAPCYIPTYDKEKHKTVFDLTEDMRGKIVCFGNGTGSIPEFDSGNENDIDILRNFIQIRKVMYVSRNNDLVLNKPTINTSISLFNENIDKAIEFVTLKDNYNVNVGRLNYLTDSIDTMNYINAIHFEEGFDSDNNWKRKVVIETDSLILRTKNGDVELGVTTSADDTSTT